MIKVLMVEEDKNISNLVSYNLRKEGFEVVETDNEKEALNLALDESISLVILDVELEERGLKYLSKIREKTTKPVLIVTGVDNEDSKVNSFEAGADDYIIKPFSIRELVARVKANIRKGVIRNPISERKFNIREGIILNRETKSVKVNGRVKNLSETEYNLLEYFCDNPNSVFSRKSLLEKVWGSEFADIRTVDVTICRLRIKLEDSSENPKIIKTRRGLGYYYELANVS